MAASRGELLGPKAPEMTLRFYSRAAGAPGNVQGLGMPREKGDGPRLGYCWFR